MPDRPVTREIAFTIMDVARMLRTYADQRARQFGISRAQWGVLVRLDRSEGLKQSELAEILDLQPISLTRLLDRLAENRRQRTRRLAKYRTLGTPTGTLPPKRTLAASRQVAIANIGIPFDESGSMNDSSTPVIEKGNGPSSFRQIP